MTFAKRALLICLALTLAGPLLAETPGERDALRREMITGFACDTTYNGHHMRIEYREGGLMLLRFTEGAVNMKWWVEDDQFCTQYQLNDANCSKLPPRISRTEQRQLHAALGEGCL